MRAIKSTWLTLSILSLYSVIFAVTASAQPVFYTQTPLQVVNVASTEESITRTIDLTNKGTEILELKVENTSCGCTSAVLFPSSLKPKQTGKLTMKMQVTGWGIKTETVTLATNDPKQPHPVITLQAKMPATVVPNPDRLMIQTHEGEETQHFLSLLLPDRATVTGISAHNPLIKAKALDTHTIDGGTLQRIEVSLASGAPVGELKDELTIVLKDAPVPQIGVAVEGFVTPDISVEPRQVFLGQMPQGATSRKVVVVQSYGQRPFSIAKIESSRADVVGKADPKIIAASHAVEIDVAAGGKVGSFLQETVKLTLSNGRVLEVPVAGMIVKPEPTALTTNPTAALRVGSASPDFTATDINGNTWKLSDLRGRKNVLLTFFPKCFTGGCAGQMASLQAELPNFEAADTQILAVSVDPAAEQTAFAAQLGLQFPLLPDTSRQLSMLYGAAQAPTDLAARQSVLIDKSGVVRWIDTDVHVQTHGTDALNKMRELKLMDTRNSK